MNRTGLALYTRTAHRASARVIGSYSTSFGLASRLLSRTDRGRIADVYALVRIADEIVDGPGADAGMPAEERRRVLDALEGETLHAMERGFSANLVVHAFATTAREVGIGRAQVSSFFASMRTDTDPPELFDEAAYRRYIYGSAEVVGEMCARVFLAHRGGALSDELLAGARRLGAAFQKVNFLRDLADDSDRLGRSYLPRRDASSFSDADKDAVVREIDDDLAVARRAIERLPTRARKATTAAADLFAELTRRLAALPAEQIARHRVSVPNLVKVRILCRAIVGGRRR